MSQTISFIVKQECLEDLLLEGLRNETCSQDKIQEKYCTQVFINSEANVLLEKQTKSFLEQDPTKFLFWFHRKENFIVSNNIQSKCENNISKIRKKTKKEYLFCNSREKALIKSIRKRYKKREWDSYVSTYIFR